MHNRRLYICMCIVHIIIVRLMWNISYHLQINNSRTYIFISLTTYQQHLNRHKSLWSSVKSQCITHERHINLKLLILIVKKWFSQCFWFPHYCFQFDENKMRRFIFCCNESTIKSVFIRFFRAWFHKIHNVRKKNSEKFSYFEVNFRNDLLLSISSLLRNSSDETLLNFTKYSHTLEHHCL